MESIAKTWKTLTVSCCNYKNKEDAARLSVHK